MAFKRLHEPDELENESDSSADFAAMLEDNLKSNSRKLNPGDRVRCEVLSLGRDHVIVSTGTPFDGLVPRNDFLGADGELSVKVGESRELFVTQIRGNEIHLSPSPTAKNLADDLEDAYRRHLVVDGKVEEVINGGFKVAVMGKRAFCPISQLDSKHIETPEEYVGKKFDFHITQYSERGRNIVVSRRSLLEEQKGHALASFLASKNPGDVVTGTVSRFEKFGAFIEIAPGLEGLAHISELNWSRVNDPSEVLELGQQVSAKILKIERDGSRPKISLSLKATQAEPWLSLPSDLVEGAVLSGKVTRCMKFGAFVELYPGIEGLVPLSEMSFTKRVARSDEVIKEGERIQVKVKEVDAFARRISLSYRDAEGAGDPWAQVATKFPVGSIHSGTVERREQFGLFVKLEDGVTGLVPKSKGLENPEFGYDKLKPNDAVKVQVIEVKTGERRISLSPPDGNGAEDWKEYSARKPATAAPTGGGLGLLGQQLQAAMDRQNKNKKA